MVEKIKKLIPIGFLCLFAIKALIVGANFVDLGIIISLGCIAGFFEYFSIGAEIKSFHKRLDGVDKQVIDLHKENEALKTYVSAQKLGAGLRSTNGR